MKVSEYEGEGHFFYLVFFSRFCMFCAYNRPRYQVSVYRTMVLFFSFGGGGADFFIFSEGGGHYIFSEGGGGLIFFSGGLIILGRVWGIPFYF